MLNSHGAIDELFSHIEIGNAPLGVDVRGSLAYKTEHYSASRYVDNRVKTLAPVRITSCAPTIKHGEHDTFVFQRGSSLLDQTHSDQSERGPRAKYCTGAAPESCRPQ